MYAPNHNPFENIKHFLFQKNMLSRLILINLGVFLFVSIVGLFIWLFQVSSGIQQQFNVSPFAYWLAVPANPSILAQKIWTLFTYMFLHEGFFHLFFNMLMLYFSGRIFLEYFNGQKLLNVYIWGGLIGGLLYVVSYNFFPVFQQAATYSILLGASASVLAVLIAIATYVPNYHMNLLLVGRVKLQHIAIFFIVVDILSVQGTNPGGHIAHLGGALWGFLYIQLLKRNMNLSSLLKFPKITFKKGPRKAYSNPQYKRPESDDEYNRRRVKEQHEVDRILEKISKSGYASLSKREKEQLFKNSNKR